MPWRLTEKGWDVISEADAKKLDEKEAKQKEEAEKKADAPDLLNSKGGR